MCGFSCLLIQTFLMCNSRSSPLPSRRLIYYLCRPVTGLTSFQHRNFIAARRLQSIAAAKPLRLLFCGSDDFSSTSLRAVYQEHLRNPRSIKSIDVLIRPAKPSGRDFKIIREVPIKKVAQELDLPIHERDTFTGWTLPKPNGEDINLLITASFGLFVPPRILNSVEYGGINIHPSMLPDFRGAAPLHHTLLANEKHTGVTLQTMHPEKFDHGRILDQTPSPGLEIPKWPNCTYTELLEFIKPKAAEMLVKGIRDQIFINGIAKGEEEPASDTNIIHPLRHASKITTQHRHVDWLSMQPEDVLRLDRVIGRPWSLHHTKSAPPRRIIFTGLSRWPDFWSTVDRFRERNGLEEGEPIKDTFMSLVSQDGRHFNVPYIMGKDEIVMCTSAPGGALLIKEITIEGQRKTSAARAMLQLEDHKILP